MIAGLGFLYLRSFPDQVTSSSLNFMTEQERLLVIARVNQDRGDADAEAFTFKRWLSGGADWKVSISPSSTHASPTHC